MLDYMLLYHVAIVTVCKRGLCSIITTSILQQVSVFHIILYMLVKFMEIDFHASIIGLLGRKNHSNQYF